MSASPPTTPGRLKPPGRPHFLSTRSLTPTTSVTYSKVAPPAGHTANKLSISSDAPSESSSIRSGHGELFAAGEDDAGLGTGAEGNAGPSVHLSEPVLDDEEAERQDSDDSDGPPPWVLKDAKGKSKAKPVEAEDQQPEIKPPVFLKQIGASQSLLQEQLRKGGAARSPSTFPRTSSTLGRSRSPSRAQETPSEAATLASAEVAITKRKYYVLTSAGKPVWSSEDEDVVDVTGQAGVMQAIVSIFADQGDRLRYIDAGSVKVAVLIKHPLFFFAVSDWGEPESVLNQHLDYLHLLVLSIVSLTQLHRLFERRLNHDLRRTLHGTEQFFVGLADRLGWDFGVLTGSLEVFTCDQAVREEVGKAITPATEKIKDLLYAIVLADGKVVSLVRPKRHSVHPSDLHILISTVLSSASLRTSETWLPICLPRYNATGFLHAYISFPAPSVGLILVSGDREGFFELRDWAAEVTEKLKASEEKVWEALTASERGSEGTVGYEVGQVGVPGLRHFLYKHRGFVQITTPKWEDDYLEEHHRRRLVTLYQRCHDVLHGREPSKFIYLHDDQEAIVGWSTAKYELYMAVTPLLSKTAAVAAAHAIVKWVKNEEHRVFLTSAPAF